MKDTTKRLNRWGLVATLVGGIVIFGVVVNRHYPVSDWLFWTYASIGLICATWTLACVCGGHFLLARLLRIRLPVREHLLFAFASGVLVFGCGFFLAGIAGLLGSVFFVAWPLILLAAGARPLWVDLRTVGRRARAGTRLAPGLSWTQLVVLLFGLAGVALLYLQILTPDNVSYDARWYHLGVAEQYVVDGRIAPFAEGWFQGTLPQFASWLYGWALLVPGRSAFFRIELAAHLEFTLFLATLTSIPLLVSWLTRRRGHRASWAAVFLFPGIFLYDSNLNLGADHVLAFWAVPIALATTRLRRRGGGVLLGSMLAGAVLTKYQAVYLLAGATVLVCYAMATSRGPRGRGAVRRSLGIGLAVLVAVSSAHWLKNWWWYGNPLYPFLHDVFGGAPWVEGARVGIEDPGWRPAGTFFRKLLESATAIFSFSFDVHDWKRFHGDVPVFGSLFTLLLLPLVLLRDSGRIRTLAAATLLGLFVWYWTYHQDRYLQALLPWMAAVTAAVILRLWRTRATAVRGATSLLIALQIVWGGDVPFLPTHAMIGDTPYRSTLKLLSSGFRKTPEDRRDAGSPAAHLTDRLDPDGVYLLHEEHLRVGLGRRLVVDGWGRQGAISYEALGEPRGVHERLRSLNVTHVLWTERPRGLQRMTDDLVFYEYVRRLATVTVKGYQVTAVPDEPPAALDRSRRVSVVGCRDVATLDWSRVERDWMSAVSADCDRLPPWISGLEDAMKTSSFLIVNAKGRVIHARLVALGWQRLFERDGIVAFSRSMN